ncbi:hypothetical protein ACKBNH_004267 [Vibrio vulnificus]
MNINVLEKKIYRARKVLEQYHDSINRICLGKFPKNACGCSSELLAEYLISKGVSGLVYVHGKRGNVSHGWLELEGLIIDITGDQFEDGVDAVYISQIRDFHDQFSPLSKDFEPSAQGVLSDSYEKFKALMEARA